MRKVYMQLGKSQRSNKTEGYAHLKIFIIGWVPKVCIRMCSFTFGQIEIASKYFHKQKQVTEIFTIECNPAMEKTGIIL